MCAIHFKARRAGKTGAHLHLLLMLQLSAQLFLVHPCQRARTYRQILHSILSLLFQVELVSQILPRILGMTANVRQVAFLNSSSRRGRQSGRTRRKVIVAGVVTKLRVPHRRREVTVIVVSMDN